MKISKPKALLDTYDWLPGYGESAVSLRIDGPDAILAVDYDGCSSGGDSPLRLRREIIFRSCKDIVQESFPGRSVFEYVGEVDCYNVGELVEFEESEFIDKAVARNIGASRLGLKHFCVQFMSENVAFHVIAADVELAEEILVC